MGLTPRTVRERKRRVAVLRQGFNFVHEFKGSELIVIRSGFVAVGEKRYLRFQHRMIDVETDKLMAACGGTAVEVDLGNERAVPIEPEHQGPRQIAAGDDQRRRTGGLGFAALRRWREGLALDRIPHFLGEAHDEAVERRGSSRSGSRGARCW